MLMPVHMRGGGRDVREPLFTGTPVSLGATVIRRVMPYFYSTRFGGLYNSRRAHVAL